MTKRFWIVVTIGALFADVNAGGQTRPADAGVALASPYMNAERGLTVAEAIATALAQEPTLRVARTEVDIARGQRLQAGLRPNPTVSFMQQSEPGGTDSQSRVEMEWPLDLFRRAGRVAVAEHELTAVRRGLSDRERLLVADVRMKYGEVVAALRDLSVSDDVVATTTRQAALVRARVEQGDLPPLERNIVDVELRRLEAERLLQAGRVDGLVIELKRVLGMGAHEPLQVRESLEELVTRDGDRPTRPDPTVAATRPDVEEAEARILVADAQIDRARRDGRVNLSVFGAYMRMDAGFPQQGLDVLGNVARVRGLFHYVSAGAVVTVPLANRNHGEVAAAQANRAAAAARLEATQLAAIAEIAAATTREERARSAVAIYREGARDQARQNLEVVTQTYELGRATVFDVLAERRRYLDFEHAYSRALREAYDARTALKRALGETR